MNVTMSHCLDTLANRLIANLGASAASPFAARQIIIPNTAMRRHLSLLIANSTGICANVRFSYLASWLWEQIRTVVPVQENSPYERDALTWRIFTALSDPGFVSKHQRINDWLNNHDNTGHYELCRALAGIFEHYRVYRDDWLYTWYSGNFISFSANDSFTGQWPKDDETWQKELWQRIETDIESDGIHPSVPFFEALAADANKADRLPSELHIFCLPHIAPIYVPMLKQLSQWTEVHLYALNPCHEFWFDIIDEKKLSKLKQAGKDMYHETGNRLLASWGKTHKSHLSAIIENADDFDFISSSDSFFHEAASHPLPTLLDLLKDAIRNLDEPQLTALRPDDQSVQIHVCHSLTREVEVLRDQLLFLFSEDSPPLPGDILVVTPDINRAAPIIDAVFGNRIRNLPQIPYQIVGRTGSRTNPVAQALLDTLKLASSRLSASDVFDLLLQPLISRRFNLEDHLDQVHAWIEESGICWGFDGKQKETMGLPFDESRSFNDGFYRLLLAYALPADTREPFGSRLPAGNPEGSRAIALGSFWLFIDRLQALRIKLAAPKDADGWRQIVHETLEDFVCRNSTSLDDELSIRLAVNHFFECMGTFNSSPLIDADVLRLALADALDEPSRHGAAPTGAVTFTSMANLRNLPYHTICVIGMDDGAFPSSAAPQEFDLISHAARPGDVSRRDSDKSAFLDLLLSARKRFYISYTGKSVQDNTEKLPSILVTELIDAITHALLQGRSPDEENKTYDTMTQVSDEARSHLMRYHPLQPFSSSYFDGSKGERIQSAHTEFCDAQQIRLSKAVSPKAVPEFAHEDDDGDSDGEFIPDSLNLPFFVGTLSEPDPMWRDVRLDALVQFFRNPASYLLRNRLGVIISDIDQPLPTDEPLTADNLMIYHLAERLLPPILAGEEQKKIKEMAFSGLEFPSGEFGRMQIENTLAELEIFAKDFSDEWQKPAVEPVSQEIGFDIAGEEWTLSGSLNDVRESGLLAWRFSKKDSSASARLQISLWIRHLFLSAAAPADRQAQMYSTCWFRDGNIRFTPCSPNEAKTHLNELMTLYRQGISEPLRFFPATALAYVSSGENIKKAAGKWNTPYDGRGKGEKDDGYNRLATRGLADALDDKFISNANTVLQPMIMNLRNSQ